MRVTAPLATRHPALRRVARAGVLYFVLTETPAQHPWAKYYSERGLARPPVADLPTRSNRVRVKSVGARAVVVDRKAAAVSAELAAAVAAVTSHVALPGCTAAPFITAMQREAVARELKRRSMIRFGRVLAIAAVLAVLLHVTMTRFVWATPSETALQAHVRRLPDAVLPLFSSARQPLQADSVVITQADQIDAKNFRYVASVTLRLRKPLYIPAVTNGTVQYRRLQQALLTARDQELRFNLFNAADAPEAPTLPLLLQQSHRAGETIVVRVPFTARRFGWSWRIDAAQLALNLANRALEGDSLERYAGMPHLIFGSPATLADVRQRVKLANNYLLAVAKTVQRQAEVVAVAETPDVGLALADQPARAELSATSALLASRPAFDPDAPAFDPNAPAIVDAEAPKTGVLLSRGGQ